MHIIDIALEDCCQSTDPLHDARGELWPSATVSDVQPKPHLAAPTDSKQLFYKQNSSFHPLLPVLEFVELDIVLWATPCFITSTDSR